VKKAIAISKIPVIGTVVSGIFLARFCSSMALLMSAKVPLLQAIQLVRQMISYYPIKSSLGIIEKGILQGDSLNNCLSQFKVYDSRMIVLIKVGEEVNQLDVFFGKLADKYSEDVDHKTGLLSTFLEPIIIIFLGIIVGFILIAMYLPMFQLSTSIGG
jgi:type IV pilus assembly protein PilC